MSFTLKLFGGAALDGERGSLPAAVLQRHRLALLALLATARSRAISREKLVAWLWPERSAESGRHLLNQAVHVLRQALGATAIRSVGDDLQLDPDVVRCDVTEFDQAVAAGDIERAAALYAGPFLDGFFLDDAAEFQEWADGERSRLASARGRVLEELAVRAERAGSVAQAVHRWSERAALDPFDSRVAVRLMEAMERAGNRAGALQHATAHQALLRAELGIQSIPEVAAVAERLRRSPTQSAGADPIATAGETPPAPGAAPDPDARLAHLDLPGGSAPAAAPSRRPLSLFAVTGLAVTAVAGMLWLRPSRTAPPAAVDARVDEIAQAVARELELRQRGDTSLRTPVHRTANVAAYELYLRGTDPTLTRTDSGVQRGLEYFRRAVALDSNYAAAWAGLARMTMRSSGSVPAVRRQTRDSAEALARKALALDDAVAEAHATLAVLRVRAYDFAGAERHFTRALALEPNHARNREWYANFYLMEARPAEALAEASRTLSLAPLSPTANAEYAHALLVNGRCAEALPRLESLKDLHPPLLRVVAITTTCLMKLGRWSEAMALIASRNDPYSMALRGYSLARLGRADEAQAIQDSLRMLWQQDSIGAYLLAFIPAGRRDRAEAFRWIERSAEDMSLGYFPGISLATAGPPLDELRDDPRMVRILDRLRNQNR